MSQPPFWKLPPGVGRGTWDYLQSTKIAEQYDDYFATSELMKLDLKLARRLIDEIAEQPSTIADFGCGTARVARELGSEPHRFLNVDLSRPMLRESKKLNANSNFSVQMNLVDLEGLQSECLDLGVCLFSSIGMIRKRENRLQFLKHVRRTLKPQAKLLLHVHNRYHSLLDPGGILWLARTFLASRKSDQSEFGDRVYAYRGLPSMYLHIFSRRELTRLLTSAGFDQPQILPIDKLGRDLLSWPSWLTSLRAGGFFAIAQAS